MLFVGDCPSSDIAFQVAADEAMLVACEEGILAPHTSILRVWRQRSWAVVLGASGKVAEDVNLAACRQRGVTIARRSSGGGTVLLGPGTLCVSWVRPLNDFPSALRDVRLLQVTMLEELAAAIRHLQPRLEVVASGDWAIGGRKCAGSAQRRMKSHVLVHVSILNRTPLEEVSRFLAEPARRPDYRAERTHDDFLKNLDLDPPRLIDAFSSLSCISEATFSLPANLMQLADRLADERFRLAEWTFRF